MKAQVLKELQDKSLKISMQDWLSANLTDEEIKKLTFKEKVEWIGNAMVRNINYHVIERERKVITFLKKAIMNKI